MDQIPALMLLVARIGHRRLKIQLKQAVNERLNAFVQQPELFGKIRWRV